MKFEFNIITQSFPKDTLLAFRKCFDCFGKTEILRIDGRLTSLGATILELTPDIYLGDDGEFCLAFGYNKFNYSDFISRIVTNSLKGYEANVPVR
jgi:D-alanine-D-alanine ligase